MIKKIDKFVLSVMFIFTLVSLVIAFIGPFIDNQLLLKGLNVVPYVGSIIVLVKFAGDYDYNLSYFAGAVLVTYILRLSLSFIIFNLFKVTDIYIYALIDGTINALLYAYFYQLFKELSYKRMEKA